MDLAPDGRFAVHTPVHPIPCSRSFTVASVLLRILSRLMQSPCTVATHTRHAQLRRRPPLFGFVEFVHSWARQSVAMLTPGSVTARQRCIRREGPQRRPQKRFGRRLEEVAKAVGGGYCRLQMPLRPVLGVRGTVGGHRLGAPEGRGYLPSLPMHPCPQTRPSHSSPAVELASDGQTAQPRHHKQRPGAASSGRWVCLIPGGCCRCGSCCWCRRRHPRCRLLLLRVGGAAASRTAAVGGCCWRVVLVWCCLQALVLVLALLLWILLLLRLCSYGCVLTVVFLRLCSTVVFLRLCSYGCVLTVGTVVAAVVAAVFLRRL